jgi:hypothetical protein
MMNSFLERSRSLVVFVLLAALVTVIAGAITVGVQQNYRMSANDPQVDATEQIATLVSEGAPPEAIVGQGSPVDMSSSLALFVMIFDKDGKQLASSGKLGTATTTPPSGIFDTAKKTDSYRFTWQPQSGTRIAAVVKAIPNNGGYVLAGRNLREVEKRESNLYMMMSVAWVVMLILCAILVWALGGVLKGAGITVIENTEVVNL